MQPCLEPFRNVVSAETVVGDHAQYPNTRSEAQVRQLFHVIVRHIKGILHDELAKNSLVVVVVVFSSVLCVLLL
jgi:hypothetical protein